MPMQNRLGRRGVALLLVLSALAVLTYLVMDFTSEVNTSTRYLGNWHAMKRLSIAARSGVTLAGRYISIEAPGKSYTSPGYREVPVVGIINGADVFLRVEDENSKFNINMLVKPRGDIDNDVYLRFKRMLKHLEIEETAADRLVDWMDRDNLARFPGFEAGARNAQLLAVEEMMSVPGINRDVYDKLSKYVTVYTKFGSTAINVNGAEMPVLLTLCDSQGKCIDPETAEEIIQRREDEPFKAPEEFTRFMDGKTAGMPFTVKATAFKVTSTAESEGLKRIISAAMDTDGKVLYWMEY